MSTMGTGVAAGVAQTAHVAQQVSREREKRVRDRERPAERLREMDRADLKVQEEQDDGESTPRLVVDDQMQERHPEQAREETEKKDGRVSKEEGGATGGSGGRLDVRA